MDLTPDQTRALDVIARQLTRDDPALARRLAAPVSPPRPRAQELIVMAVLLAEMSLVFVPLACGLAAMSPALFYLGMTTAFVVAPTAMGLTTGWVRRRWVSFDDGLAR